MPVVGKDNNLSSSDKRRKDLGTDPLTVGNMSHGFSNLSVACCDQLVLHLYRSIMVFSVFSSKCNLFRIRGLFHFKQPAPIRIYFPALH